MIEFEKDKFSLYPGRGVVPPLGMGLNVGFKLTLLLQDEMKYMNGDEVRRWAMNVAYENNVRRCVRL